MAMQSYQHLKMVLLMLFAATALISILAFVITALHLRLRRNNWLLEQHTTELTQTNAELRTTKERIEEALHDIHNRFNAERENEKLQQQLAHASKMKSISQLTGGIAHDFNNILTSIMGFAELAARSAPAGNDKLVRYMEAIQQSSLRASELVKQMLAFSHSDMEPLPILRRDESLLPSFSAADLSQDKDHHLLIVDDEKSITTFMAELFEGWGYRITTCNSAIEALVAFERNPHEYDLVITDQTMPQMLGTDLTRSLLAIRTDIPVVLYSGYNDVVNEQNYHDHGIRAFFSKPLYTHVLHETIRRQLAAGRS
jgi:CheY-like chemotaxis protein